MLNYFIPIKNSNFLIIIGFLFHLDYFTINNFTILALNFP